MLSLMRSVFSEASVVMFNYFQFLNAKAEPSSSWRRIVNEYYPRFALLLSMPHDDTTKGVVITDDGWRRANVLAQYFFAQAEAALGNLHYDVQVSRFEALCQRLLDIIAAQPDADLEWLAGLDTEQIATIDTLEETSLLETRFFRFHCGCTLERILPVLGSWREKPDELFHDAETITVQCPRCAATYLISRDMI
jgi:hypothetical protein